MKAELRIDARMIALKKVSRSLGCDAGKRQIAVGIAIAIASNVKTKAKR